VRARLIIACESGLAEKGRAARPYLGGVVKLSVTDAEFVLGDYIGPEPARELEVEHGSAAPDAARQLCRDAAPLSSARGELFPTRWRMAGPSRAGRCGCDDDGAIRCKGNVHVFPAERIKFLDAVGIFGKRRNEFI